MHKVVAFYSGFIIHCESSLRALDRRELSDDAEHERWLFLIRLMMIVMNNDQEHVQHCVGPAWRGGEPVHRHPHRHGQQCLHVSQDDLSRMRHESWHNFKMNLMEMFELANVTVFLKYVTAFGFLLWHVFPPRYNATLGHKVWSLSINDLSATISIVIEKISS